MHAKPNTVKNDYYLFMTKSIFLNLITHFYNAKC